MTLEFRARCSPNIIGARVHSAAIAQPVEQLTCNEKVQGSIPCGGTIFLLGLHPLRMDRLTSRGRMTKMSRLHLHVQEGFPSGQRDQTVNLTAQPS